MNDVKVMVVFGTRPEAIKMAPVIKRLRGSPFFQPLVVVTGQHREMLDQVLEYFSITPDYDLQVMRPDQTAAGVTSRILNKLDGVLREEKPEYVLVHGDTFTTFTASLAAYYSQTKIGHVEAGLRTGNKYAPFPEEMMRHLTDVLCDIHFAPTSQAKRNLLGEDHEDAHIYVTGNTVIDALLDCIDEGHDFEHPGLNSLALDDEEPLVLVEAHRRENHGRPLRNICRAVRRVAEEREKVKVVWSVHHNPRVKNVVHRELSGVANVHLLTPLDYPDWANLMNRAYLLLTDSGGLQEEAPSLDVPVLLLREVTERPEAVEAGTVRVVGTEEEDVYEAVKALLLDQNRYVKMKRAQNPYGDGRASARTVQALAFHLGLVEKAPEEWVFQ